MGNAGKLSVGIFAAFLGSVVFSQPVLADGFSLVELARGGGGGGKPGGGGGGGKPGGNGGPQADLTMGSDSTAGYIDWWMHSDVELAYSNGFYGQNSNIIIVDDHTSTSGILGRLNSDTVEDHGHGYWTSQQAAMVARDATSFNLDWNSTDRIETHFAAGALNVVNMSYGLFGNAGAKLVNLGTLCNSIVTAAGNGQAVFVKAAGNEWGAAVDDAYNWDGVLVEDYLNLTLIGKEGALFVGALNGNGSTANPADIASYSTVAGSSKRIQKQFLVVGVEAGGSNFENYGTDCGTVTGTCLYGTSFAAPVVSGYAAILGSKFAGATPALIVDRLLDTAREDTIANYSAAIHGQGEADLSYALAPDSLN